MARIKAKRTAAAESSTPKRRRPTWSDPYEVPADSDGEGEVEPSEGPKVAETPSGRKRGASGKATVDSEADGPDNATPVARGKRMATTPSKASATPRKRNLADRSARKKSARALVDRVTRDEASDDDEAEDLAKEIFESSDSDEEDHDVAAAARSDEEADMTPQPTETPTKRPRGRPKGSGAGRGLLRKKSPTPPPDLPPHEQYFYQNRPGPPKTSNNTLASLELLTHEEYFSLLRAYEDPHAADIAFLESLHARSFPQWAFELAQGFSVCLHGYGSKLGLLRRFAHHLHDADPDRPIVVANGHLRNANARDVLAAVARAADPAAKLPASTSAAALAALGGLLADGGRGVTLLLHAIDSPALRRPGAQASFASLAALPGVRLLCTASSPDFALQWDSSLRARFGFAFHDGTTLAPPSAAELDVVGEVHELLGRGGRRVGGRDGVAFVLRSLPENARALFRLLVGEVLVAAEEGGGGGGEVGVEYRMVYNKAVEEFICSSEMAFRTLLKE
jgi:origin recognition complex subunit 2